MRAPTAPAPQLTLHVTALEGRGVPLTGRFDRVFLVGGVVGHAQASGAAGLRSASGRAAWAAGAGDLAFALGDARALARLEAASPTVRLNLVARGAAAPPDGGAEPETFLGYVLLPLKSLERRAAVQQLGQGFDAWLPLNGAGMGAALRLKACVVERAGTALAAAAAPPLRDGDVDVAPPAIEPGSYEGDRDCHHSGPDNGLADVLVDDSGAEDEDAVAEADAIDIGSRGSRLYELSIRLSGVHGLAAALGAAQRPAPTGPLWLAYSLFGVLVQTAAVDAAAVLEEGGLPGAGYGAGAGAGFAAAAATDCFLLRSRLPDLALFLSELAPLQVRLCAPGTVLACAELRLPRLLEALPREVLPVSHANGAEASELATRAEFRAERAFVGAQMQGGFALELSPSGADNASPADGTDARLPGRSLRDELAGGAMLQASVTLAPRLLPGSEGDAGEGGAGDAGDDDAWRERRAYALLLGESSAGAAASGAAGSAPRLDAEAAEATAAGRSLETMKALVAELVAAGGLRGALGGGALSRLGPDELRALLAATQSAPVTAVDSMPQTQPARPPPPPPQQQAQQQPAAAAIVGDEVEPAAATGGVDDAEYSEDADADTGALAPSFAPLAAGLLFLAPLRVSVHSISLPASSAHAGSSAAAAAASAAAALGGARLRLRVRYETVFVPPADVLAALGADARAAGHVLRQQGECGCQYRTGSDTGADADGEGGGVGGDDGDGEGESDYAGAGLVIHVPARFTSPAGHESAAAATGAVSFELRLAAGGACWARASAPAAALAQAARGSGGLVSLALYLAPPQGADAGEGEGTGGVDEAEGEVERESAATGERIPAGSLVIRVSGEDASGEGEGSADGVSGDVSAADDGRPAAGLAQAAASAAAASAAAAAAQAAQAQLQQQLQLQAQQQQQAQQQAAERLEAERAACAALRTQLEAERQRANAAEARARDEAEGRARERRLRDEAEAEADRMRARAAGAEAEAHAARASGGNGGAELAQAGMQAQAQLALHLQQQAQAGPAAAYVLAALQQQLSAQAPAAAAATGAEAPTPSTLDELLRAHPALRVPAEAAERRLRAEAEVGAAQWRREREDAWLAAKAAAEEAWRRDAASREERRAAALEAAWADREAERQAVLVEAQERVREVEARLRRLLTQAEAKAREAERRSEDAARAADSQQRDAAALQRRLREDGEHAMQAARRREEAAERRVHEAEEVAERARLRLRELEAEAAEARRRESCGPEAGLRDALAAAAAEVTAAHAAAAQQQQLAARAERQRDEARVQVLRLAREVARQRAELESRETVETERLRVLWLGAEERIVLDGDRARLREIRSAVEKVAGEAAAEAHAQQGQAQGQGQGPLVRADDADNAVPESAVAARLKAERKALVDSGAGYTAGHPLVRRIDRALVQEARARQRLGASTT